MKAIRKKRNTGLALVEIMLAITVIVVAVIGAMGFRYYSALDARKADTQISATMVCSLLLESWRSVGGPSNYDPAAEFSSQLAISSGTGPATPADFTTLGSYHVTANRTNYYVTLSYRDETNKPRALNACVAWLDGDGYSTGTSLSTAQSVKMTTYCNN